MATAEGAEPVHQLTLQVRWGDMDALGHVNNATYFTYFEQARVAWLERLAGSGGHLSPDAGSGPVVVTASCEFRLPITYPATLTVAVLAAPPGRSSIDTCYRLVDAGDQRLYALGAARMVWVDRRSGRSTPLPAGLREALPGAG
ncbi:acyl-CoA thioesterase [Spiribacter halobius]|nr:thioesterase family protein [Spiribacter halobius]UEX77149.1 acyl-CoA thioesterase [Spiribacter halobius]